MKISLSFAALVALACAGCPSNPTAPTHPGDAGCDATADQGKKCPPCNCAADAAPSPGPASVDASTADRATLACFNLQKIGCSDGSASDCASVLRAVDASGKFRISLPGLISATTIAQARAAGAYCADAGSR